MVDIILALRDLFHAGYKLEARFIVVHGAPTFGEDNQLVPRNLVCFDSFADDTFRLSIRIIVGRVYQPSVSISDVWYG